MGMILLVSILGEIATDLRQYAVCKEYAHMET